MFEIKTKLWELKQGSRSPSDYYLEKESIWQVLDLNTDEEWRCADDAAQFHKQVEKEHLFEFLTGLNSDFDDVRGQILSLEPLLSIRKAFAIVRRESSRRKVMLKDYSLPQTDTSKSFALAVYVTDQESNKGRPICEHRKKTGHIKDTCWDLHSKPPE